MVGWGGGGNRAGSVLARTWTSGRCTPVHDQGRPSRKQGGGAAIGRWAAPFRCADLPPRPLHLPIAEHLPSPANNQKQPRPATHLPVRSSQKRMAPARPNKAAPLTQACAGALPTHPKTHVYACACACVRPYAPPAAVMFAESLLKTSSAPYRTMLSRSSLLTWQWGQEKQCGVGVGEVRSRKAGDSVQQCPRLQGGVERFDSIHRGRESRPNETAGQGKAGLGQQSEGMVPHRQGSRAYECQRCQATLSTSVPPAPIPLSRTYMHISAAPSPARHRLTLLALFSVRRPCWMTSASSRSFL